MSSTAEDVNKIGKKLEKMTSRKDSSSCAQALDLLKALQTINMTLEVLQKTRIGMIVNNLRKSITDEDVVSLSKTLIKTWKKLLVEKDAKAAADKEPQTDAQKAGNNGSETQKNNSLNDSKSKTNTNSNANTNSAKSAPNGPSFGRQSSYPPDTSNEVRLKCRELLANALKYEDTYDSDETLFDPEDIACKIENNVFKEFKDTNFKYKSRIRSRVANLNDKKNPDLKLNVLRGSIKPEKIAIMTAEEMASKDMKELRNKFTKEAINDHQMAMTSGTKTDLIKCPACKKSNCTYNQVQTRSADEPMTTFCFCNECGKRWKFC
ncbi:unnamed protein product [Medioppia subpectinata]|uniref:Transcription elongation factor n=1 Tax=Medioppia subpectinata TaxID=1979941 RepID=A0A7R9KL27_9ACAR|nr:unnamed protein product [Medioppia subpectinata]CAG2104234.1 unnamed protein product [Medioppia subpectinata]